ncbi:Uncharacterised protein [Mycobacteroides abscessus subsp. abscessus]|nr:Uncharacterised protein [Mycobacteroides abscessus subsp. abscessus]
MSRLSAMRTARSSSLYPSIASRAYFCSFWIKKKSSVRTRLRTALPIRGSVTSVTLGIRDRASCCAILSTV